MSVIFFFMLFVLGVGSAVGLISNITTNLKDSFPRVAQWKIAAACSTVGFFIGLLYITQGGLHILSLADYFGGTLLVFFLATLEIVGAFWIYGLENFSWDVEFMLKRKISWFWRVSWVAIMPFFMISISVYLAVKLESPKIDGEREFPAYALAGGWSLFIIGCLQIVLWIFIVYFCDYKKPRGIQISFAGFLVTKNEKWAPKNADVREKWENYKDEMTRRKLIFIRKHKVPWLVQKSWIVTGNYPAGITKGMQKFVQ
jgi:solute carrier family 6 amino acid transporter-like protein 5/7/9/14